MKSSVECCHLWNVREDLLYGCDPIQGSRIVERRKFCQFFDRLLDLRRDTHRGGVPLAAMDNAMSDSSELAKRVQSRRWTSLQFIQNPSYSVSVFLQL